MAALEDLAHPGDPADPVMTVSRLTAVARSALETPWAARMNTPMTTPTRPMATRAASRARVTSVRSSSR